MPTTTRSASGQYTRLLHAACGQHLAGISFCCHHIFHSRIWTSSVAVVVRTCFLLAYNCFFHVQWQLLQNLYADVSIFASAHQTLGAKHCWRCCGPQSERHPSIHLRYARLWAESPSTAEFCICTKQVTQNTVNMQNQVRAAASSV